MLKFGNKNDGNVIYKCTVRLLEDTEVLECEFLPQHKGKYLLEYVCGQLNLLERDYFGLRFVDSTRQRHWLDPAKSIIKQVKDMDDILFSFRVKFYPPDPFRLKEEITRYQVYLQLRRDLLHGRLYCTPTEAALLAAYIVQADLGDYNPEEHEGNYVQDMKLLLKQTPQIEEKIIELHQTHLTGQTPTDTETNFLRRASQLDTYGVDPHPVKDHRGNQLYLGINHCGILTFQGSRKSNHFRWSEVHKINFEGKMFIVHLIYTEDARTKKKHTVGFKCSTGAACRHVWRCAIEQMLFFTLPSSSDAPAVVTGGSFFSWGTKFRYSGRTERELLEDNVPRREEPTINRAGSLRRKAASVPATPSTPVDLADIRYSSLPRSNHSAPDSRLDGQGLLSSNVDGTFCMENNIPLLETVTEDQEVHSKLRNQEPQEFFSLERQLNREFEHERKSTLLEVIAESQGEEEEEEDENKAVDNREEQEIVEEKHQEEEHQEEDDVDVEEEVTVIEKTLVPKCEEDGIEDAIKEDSQKEEKMEDEVSKVPVVEEVTRKRDCIPGMNGSILEPRPNKMVEEMMILSNGKMHALESRPNGDGDTVPTACDLDAMGVGVPGLNDYYFRDSFEHSSSESQILDAGGRSHRSSRSQTPIARGRSGSKLSLSSGAVVPSQSNTNASSRRRWKSGVVRLLIPSVAVATVLFAIFAAVVLESPESGPLASLRSLPQMVTLRTLWYEPAKEFLRRRFSGWAPQ